MTDLVLHLVRLPQSQRSAAVVKQWNDSMVSSLETLDGQLRAHAYVAGEEPSIADFSIAPGIHRWLLFDLSRPALAHVEAWHAASMERPAFQKLIQPREYHLHG